MTKCIECEWARQVGDKTCTSTIVGCALLATDAIPRRIVVGDMYSGWMYMQRRPGDVGKSDTLGKGALLHGDYLVSAEANCHKFKQVEK